MNKLKVIDVFCGCGGLSKGFLDARYEIIAGIDNDSCSLETYKKNFPNSKSLNINLFNFDTKNIKKEIGDSKIDLIIGGPPCQGFSFTGTRNMEDHRNKLYLSFYEIVKDIKPKAFMIENVPGMAKLYDGKVKTDILEKFDKLGYKVKHKILLAAEYGVPQKRKRLFIVGLLKKYKDFEFPAPIINSEEDYIGCEEAIGDLPALDSDFLGEEISNYSPNDNLSEYQKEMRKGSNKLMNHVAVKHTDEVRKVISLVPEGKNYKALPKGIGDSRKFHEAWTRYHSKKPSKTIDTGHRNHFHYKYNRVPTVRENARLQSFNDSFIFSGPKTQQAKQVGNAVPPKLAYHIAKKIKEVLENED